MSIMELHCQVSKCVAKVEDCDAKIDTISKNMESFERRKQLESSSLLSIEFDKEALPMRPSKHICLQSSPESWTSNSVSVPSPLTRAPSPRRANIDFGNLISG